MLHSSIVVTIEEGIFYTPKSTLRRNTGMENY
jgi:hypothetical protein